MEQKVKPIIKWTGGKYREFALFRNLIPSFTRYIEPFFGGGGVFFALQPDTLAVINDKSEDLIRFYRQINKPDFKIILAKYADVWEEIGSLSEKLWKKCNLQFSTFILQADQQFVQYVSVELPTLLKQYKTLSDPHLVIEPKLLREYLLRSLLDKAVRIRQITKNENRQFEHTEFKDHFETGIKSGLYLFFRALMNRHAKATFLSEPQAAANWYFVREFCYASMFRFNAKGDFNIPYGGIAYNKKNFRQKADLIFSAGVQHLFSKAEIYQQDFEQFLNGLALTPTDFIFLDPPYDSEFSEYDQNAFTRADQLRLANFLLKCSAKWMVVIKETDFIRQIYTHPQIKIVTFGKNYTYNVRGRNNRKVTHLIITNY
jgi:DNA adenine methylase